MKAGILKWFGIVPLLVSILYALSQPSPAIASITTRMKALLKAQHFEMWLGSGTEITRIGDIDYPGLKYGIYYYESYPPKSFPSAVQHASHAVIVMDGNTFVGAYEGDIYARPTLSGRDIILRDDWNDDKDHRHHQTYDVLHIDPKTPLKASTLNGHLVDLYK